jgi:hypothetical protein
MILMNEKKWRHPLEENQSYLIKTLKLNLNLILTAQSAIML